LWFSTRATGTKRCSESWKGSRCRAAQREIGPRRWLEDEGHELITTTDREGGELAQNLADAVVLITTPFWPVYVTREMIESASSLKLILTAGVGSDHIDLAAAAENNITVAEQTNSNVVSVAGACCNVRPQSGTQLRPAVQAGRRRRIRHRRYLQAVLRPRRKDRRSLRRGGDRAARRHATQAL
jgi:phosphoglycerate dehydrogenase-like enzyme